VNPVVISKKILVLALFLPEKCKRVKLQQQIVTKLELCQDKKLNYNGSYFFQDQGKKHRRSSSYGEYF